MPRQRVLTTVSSRSLITLAAFGDLLATERIADTLTACDAVTQRHRKLSLVFTAQLCIAMSLWSDESIDAIVRKLLAGPQLRGAFPDTGRATAGAICYDGPGCQDRGFANYRSDFLLV